MNHSSLYELKFNIWQGVRIVNNTIMLPVILWVVHEKCGLDDLYILPKSLIINFDGFIKSKILRAHQYQWSESFLSRIIKRNEWLDFILGAVWGALRKNRCFMNCSWEMRVSERHWKFWVSFKTAYGRIIYIAWDWSDTSLIWVLQFFQMYRGALLLRLYSLGCSLVHQ